MIKTFLFNTTEKLLPKLHVINLVYRRNVFENRDMSFLSYRPALKHRLQGMLPVMLPNLVKNEHMNK